MGQPTPEQGPPSVMRFGDLKKLIEDKVSEAVKAVGSVLPTGDQGPTHRVPLRQQVAGQRAQRSIDDEVKSALEKIDADKKRQEREARLDADISELREKTKEKPPVEYRRVHKMMGWGE